MQRHFVHKGPYSQSYSFPSSQVRMWELDHKEGWVPKNWWFQTVVLEKILESPLDSKEIKPVSPEGNQPYSLEGLILKPQHWSPDAKSWVTGKDPDAGKDWGQEVKGTTEDEMVGRYHQLNGPKLEQTEGDSEGQGSLACCSLMGLKESNMT